MDRVPSKRRAVGEWRYALLVQVILALDQGTTSSRAILFDEGGNIVASAQKELKQFYPRPGWVEHDPREIASSQMEVAAEARAKVPHAKVRAIGITNQRETTILWDRETGEPIANAIVWQDRRTAPLCEELRAQGHEQLFRERTGLVLDPYFSATKIRWLLDHTNVDPKRLAFGTVDTWLVWQLTGGRVHVTDVTNASRTLLFDIHRREWDDELLRIVNIPRSILPRVVSSSEVVGETEDGIPIAGIAGDQQAALFGQRCIAPGMTKNTYGTGCFIVMHTGDRAVVSKHGLLTTVAAEGPLSSVLGPRTRPPSVNNRGPRPEARGLVSSRSKAASSSLAPRCNGCATACASFEPRPRSRRWRRRSLTTEASSSSPPSPASAPRTGIRTRAA